MEGTLCDAGNQALTTNALKYEALQLSKQERFQLTSKLVVPNKNNAILHKRRIPDCRTGMQDGKRKSTRTVQTHQGMQLIPQMVGKF